MRNYGSAETRRAQVTRRASVSTVTTLSENCMALADDLKSDVRAIFAAQWDIREGIVVPDPKDVQLGNDAVKLDAVVLYADLAASTKLVDSKKATFAAEIYKSYLHCASKIIRSEGGEITAFDGDRVMAVYVGDMKNTRAVRTALKINWAVINIVNTGIKAQYETSDYRVGQAVGIDSGVLLVARTGIRGSNDLVWVGRAANYAAKLSGLREENVTTWITEPVFKAIHEDVKVTKGQAMWKPRTWTQMACKVYCSTWYWSL